MTKLARPVDEKICSECCSYGFRYRKEPGGWAYCYHFKKYFPKQREWVKDPDVKKPGERTCAFWARKF